MQIKRRLKVQVRHVTRKRSLAAIDVYIIPRRLAPV